MISVSREEYIDWKSQDSTKHLVEYLEELRSDFIEAIGTGKFQEGAEFNKAIGNYQTLRIIIDYINKDFQYIEKEKLDGDQSGVV